ncbi:MAG: sigma factor, partial [Gelidibacter sp.]
MNSKDIKIRFSTLVDRNSKKSVLNKETFKDLFIALYPRLISYSFKSVQEKFSAEEIVEDCFVILWERRESLAHIDDIKPYLYIMVRNASLKYLEKSKKIIPLNKKHHDSEIMIENDIIE